MDDGRRTTAGAIVNGPSVVIVSDRHILALICLLVAPYG